MSAGNEGATFAARRATRTNIRMRISMPIDLCQTKRSSFVGESRQVTAATPRANCTTTSVATAQCSSLAGALYDRSVFRHMTNDRIELMSGAVLGVRPNIPTM
jgi:hypothetical protein